MNFCRWASNPLQRTAFGAVAELLQLGVRVHAVRHFTTAVFLGGLRIGCETPPRSTVLADTPHQITLAYYEADAFIEFKGHPSIDASINGVTGRFIIDTGAPGPLLTMTAVHRC